MSDVSIVIPAYNEEGAIAETVEAIRAALQTTPYAQAEIVVVDDGSHYWCDLRQKSSQYWLWHVTEARYFSGCE